MSGPNPDGIIQALISAAVKLKLRSYIRASFFLAWAIPIASTGRNLPSPYDQVFFTAGTVLAVAGVVALLAVHLTDKA
jgi:hypothetical protein